MQNSPIIPDVFGPKAMSISRESTSAVVPLIRELCAHLRKSGILYCHWKSNANLDKSASASNDLDLLVSRCHTQLFSTVISRLGFKLFHPPAGKQLPGVLDYYGFDPQSDKFVHVHAHHQLVLGHDATKNVHLPLENAYLESSTQGELFRVPDPSFELILLVLRMVLKHSTWDVILARQGGLSETEQDELRYLQPLARRENVDAILSRHMPYITPGLFESCLRSLDLQCPVHQRVRTGRRLLGALKPFARRSRPSDIVIKGWRRVADAIQVRLRFQHSLMRMGSGGLFVAIVGGDGSGKSTAIDALRTWFSDDFRTMTLHMGKPPWSVTTIFVRSFLKIGTLLRLYPFERPADFETLNQREITFPGYPWMFRELCTARDRLLTYCRGRRFATEGGLVLTDRFPIAQIRLMDGPQIDRMTVNHGRSHIIRAASRAEARYYDRIARPDLLIVLKVSPEITVQRKTTESAKSVFARTAEIWSVEWDQTTAQVIDAEQPMSEVLAELKSLIWSHL